MKIVCGYTHATLIHKTNLRICGYIFFYRARVVIFPSASTAAVAFMVIIPGILFFDFTITNTSPPNTWRSAEPNATRLL